MNQVPLPNLSDHSEPCLNAEPLLECFLKFRKVACECSLDSYAISSNSFSIHCFENIGLYGEICQIHLLCLAVTEVPKSFYLVFLPNITNYS